MTLAAFRVLGLRYDRGTIDSMGFTVDYEDKRVRSIPQGLFVCGLALVLFALAGGLWWIFPVAAICFVPTMTPARVVGRLFPNDEEWIARAKLGFGVMAAVFVAVCVGCVWVLYLSGDAATDRLTGSRPYARAASPVDQSSSSSPYRPSMAAEEKAWI
jgi:hypothetical protein